jgi:predicted AAA+ superfamily ATPase
MSDSPAILSRVAALLDRLEALMPDQPASPDRAAETYLWRKVSGRGALRAVPRTYRLALSDRFGLWISLYPFSQEQYLAIVHHWLPRLGAAFERAGSRSRRSCGAAPGRAQRAHCGAARVRLGGTPCALMQPAIF